MANFSRKKSRTGRLLFSATQPLGVCAIVPGDCDHSNGTAEPARWRRKPLHCQRRRFWFDASQPTAPFVGALSTHNSEILRYEKWIIIRSFRSATLAAQLCLGCFSVPQNFGNFSPNRGNAMIERMSGIPTAAVIVSRYTVALHSVALRFPAFGGMSQQNRATPPKRAL